MAKELRGPWVMPEARRPGRMHLAFVIPPGTMVAVWEKYSAKIGNRGPHQSAKARDRWHHQFDLEEYLERGHPPMVHAIPGAQKRGTHPLWKNLLFSPGTWASPLVTDWPVLHRLRGYTNRGSVCRGNDSFLPGPRKRGTGGTVNLIWKSIGSVATRRVPDAAESPDKFPSKSIGRTYRRSWPSWCRS